MDWERRQQIEELFAGATAHTPEERDSFLANACAGDEELRREVQSLLEQQSSGTLPDQPVWEPAAKARLPTDKANPPALAEGDWVSSYHVISKLGEGGMGEVYLAEDTRLGRRVALKVLPLSLAADSLHKAQLVREARAASALDHPNIGSVYGIEETARGQQCIVMAYYEGQTLSQKMRAGPLTASDAAVIAIQVAKGLAEAHSHNIVHRDIKPSNIFLTRQGLVKIIDFGVARVAQSPNSTLSADIQGTPSYMSPEQAQGKPVDGRTDLWALGTVLYEMITGRLAFAAGDFPAVLYAIVHTPPPLDEDVPRAVQRIIYRALAKRPEDRYQTSAEMIHDLRQFSAADGHEAGPTITGDELRRYCRLAASPSQSQTGRHRLRWALALLIVLGLGVVLMISMKLTGSKPAAYQSYLSALAYMQRPDKPDNLNRAISLLKEATRADPKSALALASLGQAYWLKSIYSKDRSLLIEAETHARRAAQINDRLARVHIVMGEIQKSLGNLDLSEEEFQRATNLEPSNADAVIGLARLYEVQGRKGEAEARYRRAAALSPESWEGHNSLGIFLKDHGQYTEAAERFRKVTQLTPDNVAGHSNLGGVLMQQGKLDEAEASLKTALECDPSSYAVHSSLGVLYCRKRMFRPAAAATEKALQLSDRDWLTWYNLGGIRRWLGEDGRAVEAYRRALPLLEESVRASPRSPVFQARLAEIYAYCGERDKSESRIRAALEMAPDDAAVLMGCADAVAALGDIGRAVELANRALAKGYRLADLDLDPEARRFMLDPRLNIESKSGGSR